MFPSEFKRYTKDSQPLIIDPKTAVKIGLNEAIVIRQLHYLLQINEKFDEKNKGDKHTYDNKIYSYNTFIEWQNQFPFWSDSTIKRVFYNLKKNNLIEVISNPKDIWDKTNWYTICYENLFKISK